MELGKCIAMSITTMWYLALCAATESPTVTISTGTLVGSVYKSTEGRPFNAYLGIPYAKPPTKERRFKAPEQAEKWPGILNATQDGSACPQIDSVKNLSAPVIGDEDCLFINVYKPQTNKRLAVLVYIHSGAFEAGTGRMDAQQPHNFMDTNIVLVTMNYRLGALGFLSTEDENAYGNYGLLDQVLALRWVQQNIKHFGGDPNKVTIYGQSAGAGSVALHVLSPLAKGLFRAAIAQSGNTQGYWSIQENPLFWTKKIAERVNCPRNGSHHEMIDCLRATTANDLVLAERSLKIAPFFPFIMLPVVEAPGGSGFLSRKPLEMLEEGSIESRVPILTGVVKDEGLIFAYWMQPSFKTKGEQFFDEEFPTRYLKYIVPVKPPIELRLKQISKAIQKEYFPTHEDLHNPLAFLERYSEFLADTMFNVGEDVTLRLMFNAGIKIYAYKYTQSMADNVDKMFLSSLINEIPVIHGEDVFTEFANLQPDVQHTNGFTGNSAFSKMGKILTNLFANFAKTLKPSFVGRSANQRAPSVTWLPFKGEKLNYLDLCLNSSMKQGATSNRTKFWTETVRGMAFGDEIIETD